MSTDRAQDATTAPLSAEQGSAGVRGTPRNLSDRERAIVAAFDAAPPAPESFDAHAAIRRVLDLADDLAAEGAEELTGSPRDIDRQNWLNGRRQGIAVAADRIRAAITGTRP